MCKLKRFSLFLLFLFSVFIVKSNVVKASSFQDLAIINIDIVEPVSNAGNNKVEVTVKNVGNSNASTEFSLNLIYGTNIHEINICKIHGCFGTANTYNGSMWMSTFGKNYLAPGEEYIITFNKNQYLQSDVNFNEGVEYLFKAVINNNDVNQANNIWNKLATPIKFSQSAKFDYALTGLRIDNVVSIDSGTSLDYYYTLTNQSNADQSIEYRVDAYVDGIFKKSDEWHPDAILLKGASETYKRSLHFPDSNAMKGKLKLELKVNGTDHNLNNNVQEIEMPVFLPGINQKTKTEQISQHLFQGNVNELLSQINQLRSQVREQEIKIKYLQHLTTELSRISANMQVAINTFVTYGVDDNTKKLGEGERAAVVNSYQSAYGKLPNSEEELNDIIKIANGRWPSTTNNDAESRAKNEFKHIYKREANMKNPNDNAAVTIMAYGLRQRAENRNLNSESAGLKIFKGIYGRIPQTTQDWNILQAITYSGASR